MDCAVVVPLHNGEPWIRETLASVFAQRRPPAEVVVVDDGSTDASPALVEALGRDVLLLRKERGGPSSARLVGLARSRAPLLAFLDQDDVWHPDHLARLVAALEARSEAPVAAAACVYFRDGETPSLGGRRGEDGLYDPWEGFPLVNRIDCPSMALIRRDALTRVGSWDTRFSGVADFHLWLRLSIERPFVRIAEATAGRRVHPRSDLAAWVAGRPLERLRLRQAAAEEVATLRLCLLPDGEEKARLRRRLPLAGLVCRLAEALLARDPAAISRAARAAEEILRGEPAELRRSLFRLLSYSLPRQGDGRDTGELLLESWPEEGPRPPI